MTMYRVSAWGKTLLGGWAHILSPQLLFDNRVSDVPAGNPFSQLSRLLGVMLDRLLAMRRRRLKPEEAGDFPVGPECVCNAADKRECRRPWTSLAIRNHLLHEPLVFGSFAVVQWRVLDDLARSKPDKRLWSEKSSRQIEVYFIGEAVREDLMEVLRNIRGRGVVGMVVRVPVGARRVGNG